MDNKNVFPPIVNRPNVPDMVVPPDNPQDWLDELIMKTPGINIAARQTRIDFEQAIQQHFTAQAKQHQIELLKARLHLINQITGDRDWDLADKQMLKHGAESWLLGDTVLDTLSDDKKQLQAELAKLEGEA